MQLKYGSDGNITIIGNIKSIEDSSEIKKALDELQKNGVKSLFLKIQDSFSITSTVIGRLLKLVNLDNISVSIVVNDKRLYRLLDELSLVQSLNVKLVEK